MPDLRLSFSMTPYDRVRPLITGEVKPQDIALEFTRMASPDIFYQQSKFSRFDVSEMSMSAYLIARAKGWPYRMLPVFHNRAFFYTGLLVRRGAGIKRPEDLKGKRFGFAEYAQSAALWTRGILQHEFGVRPEDMVWYQERTPRFSHSGPAGFRPPPGVRLHYAQKDLMTMMLQDELDVALPQRGAAMDRPKEDLSASRKLQRLFRDPKAEAIRYYRKTGVFPIQHITVVRESILKEHPWVAASLMDAFERAKMAVLGELFGFHGFIGFHAGHNSLLVFGGQELTEQRQLFGYDPYPYGIRANAREIDLAQTFSAEQGLTPRKQPWEDIFPEETLIAEEQQGPLRPAS
ncbi:MAG: PhnD/SsuA/transferrin family substrate-binding protein [Chloroflexi bacterium]|nr:PhnD/SsuA/transferrin family substrate-binding protein [Chloroflexota bacterium]